MAQKHTHDLFFKIAFSRTDVVADFIGAFFPAQLAERLDTSTLERINDSFVDEKLNQHYADLLYSVQYGNVPITLAFLFEHKSYVEERPHFQLLRYMVNYWQGQLDNSQPPTLLIPIIIYHGRGRWKQQAMADYFTAVDTYLRPFVPDFQYVLVDLRKSPDEQFALLKNNYAKVTTSLLRSIREKRELVHTFEQLASTLDSLISSSDGAQFVKTAFLYVHWASKLTTVELVAIFERVSPKSSEIVMSAAEVLIREGRKEGRQEGREEALLDHVAGLMEIGLDKSVIAKALKISPKKLEIILEQLNRR